MLWTPQPEWHGRRVVVIGTGPSFNLAQARLIGQARCRDAIRVIAVNDAVFPCWFADLVFAADRKWWLARDHLKGFAGIRVGLAESYHDAPGNVRLLQRSGCEGYDPTPGKVHTHGHSGAMAVQLAAQLGGAPITLVGFDMRRITAEGHFFGEYEKRLSAKPDMAEWVKRFRALTTAMPGRIVNATPGSALDFVPFVNLAEVLA